MKNLLMLWLLSIAVLCTKAIDIPWEHGDLKIDPKGTYFVHEDGTPFFWLADTGWLLPEKLTREEVKEYLNSVADAEYNVVQVQTLNAVPSINVYGQPSHTDGWDFSANEGKGGYGYWDHMDYIIDQAGQRGIYIAMVCIWGGLVKSGQMNVDQAKVYGQFLAERYGNCRNIIWVIGGDIRGDIKPDVWESLATTIKEYDKRHLMTFHPFGRTSSAYWWHNSEWLDFNMCQSGHRRYDQTRGDGDDTEAAALTEDNWRYILDGRNRHPHKPILDGEPSYEDIPQGLHDTSEPRWQASDVRRYAYWSVLAGAAGHTYGHNSVMQMLHPGEIGAYGATKSWQEGVKDSGYNQMKYLKRLMTSLPFEQYVPDQSIITSKEGYRYDRAIAGHGSDYILVYTYTNQPIAINLDKIPGSEKDLWWYNPSNGEYESIGTLPTGIVKLQYPGPVGPGNDHIVLVKSKKSQE